MGCRIRTQIHPWRRRKSSDLRMDDCGRWTASASRALREQLSLACPVFGSPLAAAHCGRPTRLAWAAGRYADRQVI